jgi:two-component system response regulator QseB
LRAPAEVVALGPVHTSECRRIFLAFPQRPAQAPHSNTTHDGIVSSVDSGSPRVLLVEDDAELHAMLDALLTDDGYQVESAADGHRGLHLGLTRSYDVLVLDRRLPAIDGIDLLGRLRGRGVTTPVLMLSALANSSDRVEGLDAGAEDYLGKPFDVDELLARLRALRRRHLDTARSLPIGAGRLDLDTRQVHTDSTGTDSGGTDSTRAARSVRLSNRECALLATLAGRPGRVYSRHDLVAIVFPEAESEIVVDTYVHYLRRKLGRGIISTVRGRGYQLGGL